VLPHQTLTTIIRGKREGKSVIEESKHITEVTNPALDVLLGIKGIIHPVVLGNEGHKLHEALSPFWRHGTGIEVGFDRHESADQAGI